VEEAMALQVFPEEAVRRFREVYPSRATHLSHRLQGHPLLEIEALERLAERINPRDLEHNAAVDLPLGISYADTPANGLSVHETIAAIDKCGSWVLLKQVQQDPAYRDLLHDVLAELRPEIEPVTGEMLKLVAFIFISSPQAVTPLHFDPEYNILFQIRGTKTMTLFPAEDREIVTQQFRETYYRGGPRNLPWREDFAARGNPIHIKPGEGIYVPILAPHWVKTHDEVSVSLSLTWRSEWSFHQEDAHRFNSRLRKLGLSPAPPRFFPQGNLAKSVAERAMHRVERLVAGGRSNAA
jgi:quercetin dioxygenase-like cupin family protein